ncbi:MAG: aminotransferase class I/II-fold pyridoxal phosphate-dependent enzyme [Calditrichaeota bacterium]|nr:aminotransferase class I/II-fold pyridoxal phosphate-dependent enzyme [Calditrichota bacterium]
MFIQQKSYLRDIKRVRVSEGRNLAEGLRLDRNEKVDVWPENFLTDLFAKRPNYFLSVYPESATLYRKLSQFLNLSESQIQLTSGIDGGIKNFFEVMTSPGDRVGVFSPTYAMYQVYSRIFQVSLTEIGYTPDLQLDRDQLDAFLETKPSILFVPNPNQPIESALSVTELKDLAKRTLAQNCMLVIDEAYYMFGCDTGLSLIDQYENVVVCRTFSKAFGLPAIRLGFMVSNTENMHVLSTPRFAHESNALSNAVAEHLLDNFEVVQSYVDEVVAGRDFAREELAKLGVKTHGSKGNYLLLDLGSPEKAGQVVTALREQRIYVKGPWRAPWDKYITITCGPTRLMQRFTQAMGPLKSKIGFGG